MLNSNLSVVLMFVSAMCFMAGTMIIHSMLVSNLFQAQVILGGSGFLFYAVAIGLYDIARSVK